MIKSVYFYWKVTLPLAPCLLRRSSQRKLLWYLFYRLFTKETTNRCFISQLNRLNGGAVIYFLSTWSIKQCHLDTFGREHIFFLGKKKKEKLLSNYVERRVVLVTKFQNNTKWIPIPASSSGWVDSKVSFPGPHLLSEGCPHFLCIHGVLWRATPAQ